MNSIASNLIDIRQRIAKAAQLAGKKPSEIGIVGVTKTVSVAEIQHALSLGINNIGENRVQELVKKYDRIKTKAQWHMIGHLQTNKVRQIIDKVDLIHSLDRWSLALEISKRAALISRKVPVLIQVNIAKEATKFGLLQEEVIPFLQEAYKLPNLAIRGLMTMAPYVENPEEVRQVFRELAALSKRIAELGYQEVRMDYLSMGMTNDFEVAIEEGANLVRIGSGIFGKIN
ncbi:MAG: YggS family pyridoxal phosphate-dependent enzyme [Bacillota bacterium]